MATRPIPNPDSEAPGPRWYAIWTRSRHEQVVREQLERKQIDAFLPTLARWSRWNREFWDTQLGSVFDLGLLKVAIGDP